MRILNSRFWLATLFTLGLGNAQPALAGEEGKQSRAEVSVLGGMQALNSNDTAIPDHYINVPLVAIATYRFTPQLALEGDFSWIIPISQQVDVSGSQSDKKSPDILSYQGAVRASWPLSGWTPYVAAGGGAVTFLSNTDPDRLPQIAKSQTVPAVNFGAGATWPLNGALGLRGDFREVVAFPSDTDPGLSTAGKGDPIWMERVTLGLSWGF
ncbi:MAG TPA: outer membrane beta-barrel protein [Candidatus Eisenbacteria bacterium]|nr:outer membrane beta-barrel protein [Candidatus Eisenbacteria bacterium]